MADGEAVLLARYAQRRDADVFRALFEVHQHMVYAVCHRLLGNPQDAEDAAQSCFLQLALKAGKLRAPIAGWLHKVAVSISIDILRQKTARSAREAKARQLRQPAPEPTWEELKGSVDEAIARLPEGLRLPLVLYYLEGRKQEDIAAELGVSQPAVSGRLSRGVAALRKRLAKAGIPATAPALSTLLAQNAVEVAPRTLSAALGKMALVGIGGGTAAAGAASAGAIVLLVLLILLVGGVSVAAGLSLSRLTGARGLSKVVGSTARPAALPAISEGSAKPAPVGSPAPLLPGRVIERHLGGDTAGSNMFIDLDTGRVSSLLQDVAAIEPMLKWMREQGIDAFYQQSMAPQSLIAADMAVVAVAASAWENAALDELVRAHVPPRASRAFPVLLGAERELPAAFLFRTREGAAGILQIEGFGEETSGGVKIRYKLAAPEMVPGASD
jgi:RNA polymerase sigma factor (sigma-70 family)